MFNVHPLLFAVKNESLEIVKMLIEHHAPINKEDLNGTTALIMACEAGYFDIVQYLVQEGKANINQADGLGFTPLHFAAACGRLEIVKFLLSQPGITINVQNISGISFHFVFIQLHMILPNQIIIMIL